MEQPGRGDEAEGIAGGRGGLRHLGAVGVPVEDREEADQRRAGRGRQPRHRRDQRA